MTFRNNLLSIGAMFFAIPAVALVARRVYVLVASGGRNVGADVVILAYCCAVFAVIAAGLASRRRHEPLAHWSVGLSIAALALLVVSHLAGVFRPVWW
ncbi:MAG: hypothetical protein ACYC7A_03050 [Thermoanaerobaculia bacterium]